MEEKTAQDKTLWSIKAMRVNRKMTLKEAADQLCICVGTLIKLEKGEKELTLRMAKSMSKLYGVPIDLFDS